MKRNPVSRASVARTSRGSAIAGTVLVIAACVAVAVSGCSSDRGLTERYAAEKLAWRAAKNAHAMRANPELATDEMRGRLAKQYREIIRRFPPPQDASSLSEAEMDLAEITGMTRMRLAALVAAREGFEEASSLYSSVRDSYSFNRDLAVEASLSLADLKERTGRWEEAVSAYDRLVEEWPPATSEADLPDARILRAPLDVAAGYRAAGDARAGERFRRARAYLEGWASRWPGSSTAELAMSFRAESFVMQERWSEAVRAYEQLEREYGHDANRPGIWLALADLYANRLGQDARAREYYRMVAENYPDQVAAATASLELARYEIEKGQHASARARLEEVIEKFADEEPIVATAMYDLARSYELEGIWDSALAEFNLLARQHPTSMYGMTALQHVADHYEVHGETEAARAALEKAASHYQNVIRDYASTPAELTARGYLIDARIRQQRWEEAARLLVETAERFSNSESSPSMLLQAADILNTRLGRKDDAARVLESIIGMYEGRSAAVEAERRLKELR